jgi:hypothetical protein
MDQRFQSSWEMARALTGEAVEEAVTRVIPGAREPSEPSMAAPPISSPTPIPAARPERKRGGRTLLWVGLAAGALFCIGIPVVIGLVMLISGGGGVSDVTATPEPAVTRQPTAVPPTTMPTLVPTIPPPTPRPTNTPEPVLPGGILFQDDFSDSNSGWDDEDFENGRVGYGNGYYFATSEAEGIAIWGVANQNFADVVIDVDATQVSAPSNDNNAYGLMCRAQSDGDGYLLRVSGDGFYAIHRIVDGDFQPLVNWTTSDVINQGNDSNHLRAVCDGSQLALFVNGEMIAEAEDDTFSEGDIGLTATTFEVDSTEVQFDNLVVAGAAAGPPVGGVLFQDDFSDPNTGWEVGDFEDGSVGYGDGYYFVTATRDGGAMWGVAYQDFIDVVIDVEATQVEGPSNDNNAYGIKCRVQSGGTGGDGYALMISGDGFYSIQIVEDGDYTALVSWERSDVINQGNATNYIRAVCDGTHLALIVNGELLAEADDSTYASGDVSFMAATLEPETTEIHFDNLVVTEP